MEAYLQNIINNIRIDWFWTIWFSGAICIIFYNFICDIINAIENKIWIMKDYEKIIAENLGTYDSDDYKEKKLIALAKENVEKRKKRKDKFNKIFKKGNKK